MAGYVAAGGARPAEAGFAGSSYLVRAEEAEAQAQDAWRQVAFTQWQNSLTQAASNQAAFVALEDVERRCGGQVARLEIRLHEMQKSLDVHKAVLGQRVDELHSQQDLIRQLEGDKLTLQRQLQEVEQVRGQERAAAEKWAEDVQRQLVEKESQRRDLADAVGDLQQASAALREQLQTSKQESSALSEKVAVAEQAAEQAVQKLAKATARQERVDELEKLNGYLREKLRDAKKDGAPATSPTRATRSPKPTSGVAAAAAVRGAAPSGSSPKLASREGAGPACLAAAAERSAGSATLAAVGDDAIGPLVTRKQASFLRGGSCERKSEEYRTRSHQPRTLNQTVSSSKQQSPDSAGQQNMMLQRKLQLQQQEQQLPLQEEQERQGLRVQPNSERQRHLDATRLQHNDMQRQQQQQQQLQSRLQGYQHQQNRMLQHHWPQSQ